MTVSGSHKYSGGDYKTNIYDENEQKGGKQHKKPMKMKRKMSTYKTEICHVVYFF